MKNYKKRTIALVLASVVTVAGSFASTNYKNSLMGLTFKPSANGSVNMVVQTKTSYSGNVVPIKKDANTYILMLPEVNSLAPTPNVADSGYISSVNIRTMPYSNQAKGYTRITIKTTTPTVTLSGENQVFIPSQSTVSQKNNSSETTYRRAEAERELAEESVNRPSPETSSRTRTNQSSYNRTSYSSSERENKYVNSYKAEEIIPQENEIIEAEDEEITQAEEIQEYNNNAEKSYLFLWAFLLILISSFLYVKAKNKMQEIAGESLSIDTDIEEKKHKGKEKIKKIKNTIKKLDSAYSKTAKPINRSEYTVSTQENIQENKPVEELNIVDLDELFQEQKTKTQEELDEENAALEEFLSGFSFDEEYAAEESKEENSFDEELYQKTLENKNLVFTQKDVECINQLLGTEINDDTKRNLEDFVATSPIKPVSREKILEDLVTTYTISHNITFTKDDIDALFKIMSVEIDKDFITDLRTNPKRVSEMRSEIMESGEKLKKPSEIITLKVKDMLPDLTEALRKQGNREIDTEHRAETIYFSEGYEVSKLKIEDDLPDLSKETFKKNSYTSKPSAEFEIVDNSYSVGSNEIKASDSLPDLKDVMANPEKYAKPQEKPVEVNEEDLLKNITNVQFKPFYDGSNEFEVLNSFENVPTVNDIQQEFSQFEGFEITEEEQIAEATVVEEYDDFKSLYSEDYVDLDKEKEIISKKENEKVEKDFVPLKIERNITPGKKERKNISSEVLQRIKASREQMKQVNKQAPKEQAEDNKGKKCILEGQSYTVLSSVNLADNKGCHLIKNENGYVVVGYFGDRIFELKTYPSLKSEKIQARLNEKLSDNTLRYIIRIGINKFIVDVNENEIKYVMDLC